MMAAAVAPVAPGGFVLSNLTEAAVGAAAVTSPTNLGTITLAWNHSPDPNVLGYAIYFWITNGGPMLRADAGMRTRITLTGLVEGATYQAWAVGYDAFGDGAIPSNTVEFVVPVRVYLRTASYHVGSYGRAAVTNRILISSDLKNWTPLTNFVGRPGVFFQIEHKIGPNPAYFRVVLAP